MVENTPDIEAQIRAFGENLRSARWRAGMTQSQLAGLAPIDRAAISRLECGERSPDMATMLRLCAALEVQPTDLLRGVGIEPGGDGGAVEGQDGRRPDERFGVNLRSARKRAGISQERLALDAKVDRAAISVYENGGRQPNLRTVLKLASKLEVGPATLLHGIEARPGKTQKRARAEKPRARA